MLIVMAEQSGLTVGKLFAGAIIPGLILSGLYITYILYQSWRHPHKGPALSAEERAAVTAKQLMKMLVLNLLPPLLLIISVLGVLFAGIATPTEASASGCLFAFVLYVAYGKFNVKGFIKIVSEATRTSAMVLVVMIGATCFTGVFMGLGGGAVVKSLILGVGLGKWGTFLIMMLISFFLGMFLDWIAIVMIVFPIYLPIAQALGFDILWFVVAMAVMLQDSFCTPPFGYNLFYLKGCAPPEVTTKDIYLGAVPFWILMEVGLVIVCVFPATITWLPAILVR
jgi:tripartite ATP-independent transporter DctM subunit